MARGGTSSSSLSLSGVLSGLAAAATEYGPKLALVGTLFACDRALQAGAKQIGLTFPPALVGMLAIVAALSALSSTNPGAADKIQRAAAPGLDWVSRWLPLFYVPSLVVLPLAVRGIPGADLAKMLAVVVLGMPATLLATAAVAVAIRNAAKTPLGPPPPADAPAPFSRRHYVGWGSVAAASGAVLAFAGPSAPQPAVLLFLLASTILGYLGGVAAPPAFRSVIHPVISCAAAANAAVALAGVATGAGYDAALASYLTKGAAGYRDPIARGLATAGAAHGLGTAALARSEPDALPFCALGYALIGVAATVLASLPPVTAALLAITA